MSFYAHPTDARTIWSRRWRIQNMYPIRTEDRGLRTLSFSERPFQAQLFTKAQERKYRGIRIFNVKSRKVGVTTFWGAFYLDDTLFSTNTTSCILAHKQNDVQKIFRIVKTMYKYCPKTLNLTGGKVWQKPVASYDNKNELVFPDINSTIYVALESRGETNNNLHVSEAAHIKNAEERMAATMESVPNRDTGSNITVESTSAGVGGWFYDNWYAAVAGANEFDPMFLAWFMVPKNRMAPPPDFFPNEEEAKMIADVIEHYNITLTPEQVYWWRVKKAQNRRLMNQEHPTFPDDSFLSFEGMVFDEQVLRRIFPVKPLRMSDRGSKIFVEPKPGRRYVIGCDPSGGEGGDATACEVVDVVTLEQVAEFHSHNTHPARVGEDVLPELGRMYNNALVAIERNTGGTVIDRIRPKYGNLFMQRTQGERKDKKTKKIGWATTEYSRGIMLDSLEEVIDDGTFLVRSAILKDELLTFIFNEEGRREAKGGKHDDTVMATAIAVAVARMPKASYGVYELT